MIGSKQKALSKLTKEPTVASTGTVLTVPENTCLKKPIFIDHIRDALQAPTKVELKNHIVLKAGSKALIIEMLVTTENTSHCIQNVSHYHLEEGAHLTHIYYQKTSPAISSVVL